MSHKQTGIWILAAAAASALAFTTIGQASAAPASPRLSTSVAPGGNFNLTDWELQLPTGSPGSPTTITPKQLEGAKGFQDSYFYTNKTDGSMEFWDPENGVTTPNSHYSRSELREMTSGGSAAAWAPTGTNTLSATVMSSKIPDHVCVGQIHLTTAKGSTKPLAELYYHSDGSIALGIEDSPTGGQTPHPITTVPLGKQWSYVISLSGNTLGLTVNGTKHTFTVPSSFKGQTYYFKAGDYDQSTGSSSTVGAQVQFYALSVQHG